MAQEEQTDHEIVETPHRTSKKKNNLVTAGIIIAIIVIIGGSLAWLYTGTLSSAKEKVFNVLPLPAAIVDMKFISAKEVLTRITLAKQLVESQGMTEADPAQIYDQLLETKKLAAIASNHKLSVSSAEIEEEYQNIVNQYGEGDEEKFKVELDKTYHMSPDKFKNEVMRQEILQAKLSTWYSQQQDLNKSAYDKAKDLQAKIDGGQSFEEVTTAYTQDEATKDFGGDSGLIPFDDLLPEFRTELKDSKAGDTKLVASRYGLHILKILELNNDGPDGKRQVHMQQLFIKQDGFTEWLQKETDNIRVLKLLKFS